MKHWYEADVIGYPATYPCPACRKQARFTFTRATGRKTCDECGAFVDVSSNPPLTHAKHQVSMLQHARKKV